MAKRARRYLTDRGFNLEQLDSQGVGYCDEHYKPKAGDSASDEYRLDYYGRIILPFKRHGKLIYYIARTLINDELRYKNPAVTDCGVSKSELLFNEDALNIYDDCFLLEGVFDALTLGPNALSSQGWSLSKEQKAIIMRSACKHLIIVPDKDFYKQAIQTAMQFLDVKTVSVVNMDNVLPDKPELKDVNGLGRDAVMEEIKNTPILTYGKAMEIMMD